MSAMHRTLVVVEDDRLTQEELVEVLEEEFPDHDVRAFSTEREFREALPTLDQNPPVAFLIDVMLRWDDPRLEEEPPPPDAAEQGFYRAGLRCVKALDEIPALRRAPIILFSALDSGDVERDATEIIGRKVHDVVMKSGSFDPLVRSLRRALPR